MYDWYSDKARKVVGLTEDAVMADAEKRHAEHGDGCSKYVFAYSVLLTHFREAQRLIEGLAEERTRDGRALEALHYAAEDILDCDEFSTLEPDMPIYAWL